MGKKGMGAGKAPKWTTSLPASLRTELEQLGHLKKPKLSRKDKRKANRSDGKQARADHFANKRKADDDEPAGPPEVAKDEPAKKKRKQDAAAAPPSAAETKPAPRRTALEKLLAKQEGEVVDEKRPKSKVESNEDKEIAWLEAKLGVRGPAAKAKGKWKEEFADDGLDGPSFLFRRLGLS